MDTRELLNMIDNNRWLINNGIVSDYIKDNLFEFAALTHEDVKAVGCDIDVSKKLIHYSLFVPENLLERYKKYTKLVKLHRSKNINLFQKISLWHLLRQSSKRYEILNFNETLDQCVKNLCGNKWNTIVKVLDVKEYTPNFGDRSGQSPAGENMSDYRKSDG
jgi:hypothetical protein